MIRLASPMPLAPPTTMTMAMIQSEWPRPWRCGVCHFVLSLVREELGLMWEEREKIKTISERREKTKSKNIILVYYICPYRCAVANLQRYEHKWYNFDTYVTSDKSCFLCLVWDTCQIFSIWYISHVLL